MYGNVILSMLSSPLLREFLCMRQRDYSTISTIGIPRIRYGTPLILSLPGYQ